MSAPRRRAIWPGSSARLILRTGSGRIGWTSTWPWRRLSDVERAAQHAERRLARRLGQLRMRVADARKVLARHLELHRHDAFADQLRHHRSDHVHAEDLIGLRVRQDLDEARRVTQRARPS